MVADRLGKYIDFKSISYYAFENELGVSRGSISKAVKENKNIGSNVLENILIKYPDLNADWLLTGKGKMIRSEESQSTNVEATIVYKSDPKDLEIIKDKARIIALLEDKIRILELHTKLHGAVLDSARSVDTMPDTGTHLHHK